MDPFILEPGSINLIVLTLLAGIVIIMLVINSYMFMSERDKVLGFYNIYLFTVLLFVLWNFGKAIRGHSLILFNSNFPADQLFNSIVGIAYLHFFGRVFNLPAARKFFRYAWKAALLTMYLQFLLLLVITCFPATGKEVSDSVWQAMLVVLSLSSLVILGYSLFLKRKTTFQFIILSGAVLFYILVLLGNINEVDNLNEMKRAVNLFFVAILVENIFFAAASASRNHALFKAAEILKENSFRQQLDTARITAFFTSTIHQHEHLDNMLRDVSENLIGKLGFENCMIYLWNEDKTLLVQKAGFGSKGAMTGERDKTVYDIPKGKGITWAAVESREYILVNDTSKDSRYFTADGKIQLSELCVPVIHNNETLGAINTEHSERYFFSDRHVQALTTIASMLAEKLDTLKAQHKTREKETEVLNLNKNLASSQLTALRAQMNPHFIFNALNSIQQYVLQGNVQEANKYLSRFSKLQREVLNHSNQEFISLEKEVEVLSLYLELEQLRFDESFSYQVSIDSNIDPDEIKIPPMIIQPFVENAIWHGLMPRQGERRLNIRFELSPDDLLVCIVTDNGIGRDASAKLKHTRHGDHQSKGLSLVVDRLRILRQQYGQAFDVHINDLHDDAGVPAGTEVKLEIYTG